MTVDRAALRASHVEGWKPRQSVQIEVAILGALLDELDDVHRLLALATDALKVTATLDHAVQQLRFELRQAEAHGAALKQQGEQLRTLLLEAMARQVVHAPTPEAE